MGEAATGHGNRRPTGYNEAWKANNIYDLAGNVMDWTMEASYTYFRVLRGGYYSFTGATYPARNRYASNYPTNSDNTNGCRTTLYIK